MFSLSLSKYRVTVYGADNQILVVQEFTASPYTRYQLIEHLLAMFAGEWHSYIVSLIG